MPSVGVSRWSPLAESTQAAAAREIALAIANRLRSPVEVEGAVVEARLQSNLPKGGPQWAGYGLAQGYAGLALLFGHLDRCFPGDGWDRVAHRHLEIAAHDAASRGYLPPGLSAGLSGLAFAASYLSQGGARYQRLLATLDQALIDQLKPLIANVREQRHGVPVNAFDLISGLSGAGVYLLSRRESPDAEEVLDQLVDALIELSLEDDGLPRWHTPRHLSSSNDVMLEQLPHGYLNCGLAHGIPGPLAVLSLSRLAGLTCAGLDEAIHRFAAWILAHRLDDQWGINWPAGVGLLPASDGGFRIAPVEPPQARAGWCYGSPGVSRSLYLAGLALRSREYCDLAAAAAEAVLRRPVAMRWIDSPTFCHGVAGLLQVLLRLSNDTGAETLRTGASTVLAQLLALHEPESLLGYRSIEFEGKRVDQPGLLDGAPGVALVLLAAACPVEPDWDRAFLVS